MKKSIFFLIFTSLFLQLKAQSDFQIEAKLLPEHKIKLFSESRGTMVTYTFDGKLFFIGRDLKAQELTSLFGSQLLSDVSSIQAIDEKRFLVGTKSQSLFIYDEGTVTDLKSTNPDLPNQINSIDFSPNIYGDRNVLIATSDYLYYSSNLYDYVVTTSTETTNPKYNINVKFLGNRGTFFFEDYDRCVNLPGDNGIMTSRSSSTIVYRVYEDDQLNFNVLHDAFFLKNGGGSGFYETYAFYGTDNGIYVQNIYSCSDYVGRHFEGGSVYNFSVIPRESGVKTLIASDKGLLYFIPNWSDMMNGWSYPKINGIDSAYTVDFSRYHKKTFVGTNNGIDILTVEGLIDQTATPAEVLSETLLLCQEEGVNLRSMQDGLLDLQWYKGEEPIKGEISTDLIVYEPGDYYISFQYEGEIIKKQVAHVVLDTVFNERIDKRQYLICPNSFSQTIRVTDADSEHRYDWYSLENGLIRTYENENRPNYSTREGGKYHFIATNCNGIKYYSDTVTVVKSELGEVFFDEADRGRIFCDGDLLYVQGGENAVGFEWTLDWNKVGTNDNYFEIEKADENSSLKVEAIDQYGCITSVNYYIDEVYSEPQVRPGEDLQKICSESEIVYINTEGNARPIWEGRNEAGEYFEVGEGTYDVVLSNGICEDNYTVVTVKRYDPLPLQDTVFEAVAGEEFYVFADITEIINYSGDIVRKLGPTGYNFVISSDVPATKVAYLTFSDRICTRTYSITVNFIEKVLATEDELPQVYPNPANNRFSLMTEGKFSYFVYDINGKLKTSGTGKTSVNIDSDGWLPGLYIVETRKNDKIQRTKLLINTE